jgi:hypothetical protein
LPATIAAWLKGVRVQNAYQDSMRKSDELWGHSGYARRQVSPARFRIVPEGIIQPLTPPHDDIDPDFAIDAAYREATEEPFGPLNVILHINPGNVWTQHWNKYQISAVRIEAPGSVCFLPAVRQTVAVAVPCSAGNVD